MGVALGAPEGGTADGGGGDGEGGAFDFGGEVGEFHAGAALLGRLGVWGGGRFWCWGVGFCWWSGVVVHQDLDLSTAVLGEVADVAFDFWDFVPGVGTLIGCEWLSGCGRECGGRRRCGSALRVVVGGYGRSGFWRFGWVVCKYSSGFWGGAFPREDGFRTF